MAFTLPMVQDKASSPFQVTPALKSKKAKKGKSKRRQQQAQGQVFDPVKLQQGIAENQQEILQTPAAKRRNRDAEDPFKNGFFKTNEQRREIEKKYSSVPNLRIDKNQEPAPGQTPAQKLFAPATPPQQAAPQQNDPKATAKYRDRMAKHRRANTAQAPAPQQKQKSFNQGALTDQEYADMEAKAAMAKNRASSVPLPDPSRYQKALAAAGGAQDTAGNQSGNDIKTNIFGGMQGFESGQASSQAAGKSMDELAQAAADWQNQNTEFDRKMGVSALPKVANQQQQNTLPQVNPLTGRPYPPQQILSSVPGVAPDYVLQALNGGVPIDSIGNNAVDAAPSQTPYVDDFSTTKSFSLPKTKPIAENPTIYRPNHMVDDFGSVSALPTIPIDQQIETAFAEPLRQQLLMRDKINTAYDDPKMKALLLRDKQASTRSVATK